MTQEKPFAIVHPLDDIEEVKVDTENLGPMRMTATVRVAAGLPAAHVRTARLSRPTTGGCPSRLRAPPKLVPEMRHMTMKKPRIPEASYGVNAWSLWA